VGPAAERLTYHVQARIRLHLINPRTDEGRRLWGYALPAHSLGPE